MSGAERKTERRPGGGTAHLARQRRGGISKELLEYSRNEASIRQKICEVLRRGPMTVPEIHAATGLPTDRVFWHLMAWKKYGRIVEGGQCGEYYQYDLAPEDRK